MSLKWLAVRRPRSTTDRRPNIATSRTNDQTELSSIAHPSRRASANAMLRRVTAGRSVPAPWHAKQCMAGDGIT
jgi:hypothetical protein